LSPKLICSVFLHTRVASLAEVIRVAQYTFCDAYCKVSGAKGCKQMAMDSLLYTLP